MLKLNDHIEYSYFAFFDVDGTLIRVKSMFNFLRYYYCHCAGIYNIFGQLRYLLACWQTGLWSIKPKRRELINEKYYRLYKGHRESLVMHYGQEWFEFVSKYKKNFFNQKLLVELRKHKLQGAGIVLVSGSFSPCLNPLAKMLSADIILASNLEVSKGRYTGKLKSPPIIGGGKAEAIKNLFKEINFDEYEKCFAYGDHISDLSMLSLVGNAVVIEGDPQLEKYGRSKNWPILKDNY